MQIEELIKEDQAAVAALRAQMKVKAEKVNMALQTIYEYYFELKAKFWILLKLIYRESLALFIPLKLQKHSMITLENTDLRLQTNGEIALQRLKLLFKVCFLWFLIKSDYFEYFSIFSDVYFTQFCHEIVYYNEQITNRYQQSKHSK